MYVQIYVRQNKVSIVQRNQSQPLSEQRTLQLLHKQKMVWAIAQLKGPRRQSITTVIGRLHEEMPEAASNVGVD